MELRKVAHPILEKLANQSQETIHLLILDNEEAIYIDKLEYPHTIQLQSYIGKHIPLHSTASGKLLLANLPEEEKRRVCEMAIKANADFVKTSTGFGSAGATLKDVKLMKSIVGDYCKIKVAGGIRTLAQVLAFIEAGAERIGTSRGVEIIGGISV